MNELLQLYVKTGSQQAFGKIVQQHIDAVYSQCLRKLQDRSLAEDATQMVFVSLAKKASSIGPEVVLGGWLFNAARYCCSNVQRLESRRARREQKVARMRNEITSASDESGNGLLSQAGHLLDDAIASLSDPDRDAIVLRYFEGQNINDLAQTLGVSPDAAKQRVCRAVNRLRTFFASRDIAMPSAILEVWLDQVVKPASPDLAATAAHAATSAGSNSVSILANVSRLFAMQGMKTAACAAAVAILAAGAIVTTQPAGADTAPPATAPAKPATAQSTPLDTLARLSNAIKNGSASEAENCFYDDGSDPELASAMLAVIRQNVAMYRLDEAFRTMFGQPLTVPGMRLSLLPTMTGGMEAVLDRCLASPDGMKSTITGDTATYRIPLPREMFSGAGPSRIAELGRWSGAQLLFNRVNGEWKLNTSRSFTLVLGADFVPNALGSRLQISEQNCIGTAILFNDIADGILSGAVPTPQIAATNLSAGLGKVMQQTKSKSFGMMIMPAVGG